MQGAKIIIRQVRETANSCIVGLRTRVLPKQPLTEPMMTYGGYFAPYHRQSFHRTSGGYASTTFGGACFLWFRKGTSGSVPDLIGTTARMLEWTRFPALGPYFPQIKRATRQQGSPFLWEAVPTEAKLSELSGARVCSAPDAVKNDLGEILTRSFSYI